MRLAIELVPDKCWYRSLRSIVSGEVWDKIRHKVYKKAGYKCEVCGADKVKLYCHELWSYDDETHIQKLRGFECVCELCHRVNHIGLAGIQLGEDEYKAVIRHYLKVNECSYGTYELEIDKAFCVWERRSKFDWTIDYGEYAYLVKE